MLRRGLAALVLAALVLAALVAPAFAAGENLAEAELDGPTEPMRLVVSLSEQRVDVYRGLEIVDSSRVSSGKKGYSTPAGVYSILQKAKWHRSNIYSGAPMPFMQRITWSGIALHSSNQVPNHPASHGCIRLPDAFARKLYGKTDVGIDVIVTQGQSPLEPIVAEALFQPARPRLLTAVKPRTRSLAAGMARNAQIAFGDLEYDAERMRAWNSRSRSPLRILVTRRTGRERMMDIQTMLAELGHDPGAVDGYLGGDTGGAIQSFQKSIGKQPTGMVTEELISDLYAKLGREEITGHLYVRQDYVDLFDARVAIADEAEPLGTHFYTAGHFEEGANQVRWSALTVGGEGDTPAEALARIEIPDHLRQRISELLTPGSSLVISDEGLGRETGKGTDFVVQIR